MLLAKLHNRSPGPVSSSAKLIRVLFPTLDSHSRKFRSSEKPRNYSSDSATPLVYFRLSFHSSPSQTPIKNAAVTTSVKGSVTHDRRQTATGLNAQHTLARRAGSKPQPKKDSNLCFPRISRALFARSRFESIVDDTQTRNIYSD